MKKYEIAKEIIKLGEIYQDNKINAYNLAKNCKKDELITILIRITSAKYNKYDYHFLATELVMKKVAN